MNYQIQKIYSAIQVTLAKASIFLTKKVFTKKSIVFVTENGIKTFNLGVCAQLAILTMLVYSASFVSQAIRSNVIINSKEQEINRLVTLNDYYKDQFSDINEKLGKVDEYLTTVNKDSDKNQIFGSNEFHHPRIVNEKTIARSEKHILDEIGTSHKVLAKIKNRVNGRIKNIEYAVSETGLSLNKFALNAKKSNEDTNQMTEISLNDVDLTKRQGGPLVDANHSDDTLQLSSVIDQSDFTNEIDYLIALEKLAQVIPFSKPMKYNYISSGFGQRIDPITGERGATHMGLDIVGQENAKVISPSEGKVIFAGRFMGYGNAIVIDHGFGITTRYGHLSKVKVRQGQIVEKGEIIGLQGSTGRSTGAHLHYEVRYKNQPLNPKNFLRAGEALFARN